MSVEVTGLTHRYGERVALSDVSFTVPRGTIFGLAGPNGGGKTTLFRILSTSMKATSGTVRILETDLADRRASAGAGGPAVVTLCAGPGDDRGGGGGRFVVPGGGCPPHNWCATPTPPAGPQPPWGGRDAAKALAVGQRAAGSATPMAVRDAA